MSDKWTNSKWAKEEQGKSVRFIMSSFFQNCVVYTLKIAGLLICVLRLVDTEKKPPTRYIYEAMDRVKESIVSSFGRKEEKYENIFKIIDHRWDVQLQRPLHAAGYFLNPEFFYANLNVAQDGEIMTGCIVAYQSWCQVWRIKIKSLQR